MGNGSGRGYHFISEWRTCPRKWFLHNVAGLESNELKAATSNGTILHALQEQFYLGSFRDNNEDYKAEILEVMLPYKSAWFEDDDFDEAFRKMGACFKIWRNTYGTVDVVEWEVEGTELHLEEALPNGKVVSGNLDVVFRNPDLDCIVLKDTKTTSWSPEAAHKKVELGDQVTMYTWLLHKKYGDKPITMIPDIAYFKPKMPTVHRFGSIHRSHYDVEALVFGLCHDTDQMVRDLKAYENNEAPPEYLFPRCATVCSEFGCEYEDICRARLDETTPPPMSGFSKKDPITSETLFKIVDSKPVCP